MQTLVIGYGNPLRGDDGAGPFVAEQLGTGAIVCPQLTPELAEPISQAQRVLFVDAHAGVPAGRVRIQLVEPGPAGTAIHHCEPETLLSYARQLYGRSPEAFLIGMGVESFELGAALSPAARRAARAALRAIQRLTGGARKPLGAFTH